jgi:hypothetical protein
MNEDLKQLIIDAFTEYEVSFIGDIITIKGNGVKYNVQYNESNTKYGQPIPDTVTQIIYDYINQ